ncbi:protein phosphatase 1 regulatory subunit 15A [Zootoca vivipara]|uniref:protein phosphatase 1 regulatory subunit 15A n=1 Tax=Zootoca vivipara TaxID=8524 RepID=UPI00158FCB54|nr:protein phosphatase 1 regulatory subunit 15A [Zootoca vivipara]
MPPHITSSQLTSHPSDTERLLICCDPFRLRMAKILPAEPSRSSPAGKFNMAAMILGRMAQIAMDWVRRWLDLWQHSPATLVRAVLMGIAKGAMPILEKTRQLLRGTWEELGREESKVEGRNLKAAHLGYLSLGSHKCYPRRDTESLAEGGHFEEDLALLLTASNGPSKMDSMRLEEDGISEPYLISTSIACDLGNDWDISSEEDMALEGRENPGSSPQKWLEYCCHPQALMKGLNIGGYCRENVEGSCSHHRELKDFGGGFRLEGTSASQGNEEGLGSSGDLVRRDGQSFESPSDSPKDGEEIEAYKKGGDKSAFNSPSCVSKSPLVLSLFYSPSEEEEDGSDDSEDWWSEDEMEESIQSGGHPGNRENHLEAEVDSLHQDVLESPCESFFASNNPFHPLCFSKPVQAPTSAPQPEAKNHKEITVTFYQTRLDSKPEELCNPPTRPHFMWNPRVSSRHPTQKCCQPDSEDNSDLVTTEVSSVSQEANQVIKKVRFSPVVTVHPLVVWNYASRAARRGPWEEMARDRCRFRRRIAEVGAILEPCLRAEHRAKAWREIYGVQQEGNDNSSPLLSGSAEAD